MRGPGLAVILFGLAGTMAHAGVVVTWTFQNATLNDGGTINGSYNYDATLNLITNWSVTTSGGDTVTFPALNYNPGDSTAGVANDFQFNLTDAAAFCCSNPNQPRILNVALAAPMTDAGGSINLITGNSGTVECYNCNPFRSAAGGSVVGVEAVVPEPASGVLVFGAAALAAMIGRMRRRLH